MTRERQQTGKFGEQLACEFLNKKKYHIIEQNYRCKIGEIDLIAKIEEYLVFCEVKTRADKSRIHPSASVTAKKKHKLHQLGLFYIQQKKLYQYQPRFDVISIKLHQTKPPEIEHFINAL